MTNNKKNIPINLSLEDEIDLRSSKKLIILTTLIFTLISAAYYYSLKPVYDSSSSINLGLFISLEDNVKQNVVALRKKYSELNIERRGVNNSVLHLSINNHSSSEEYETLQEATNFAVMLFNKMHSNQKNIVEAEKKDKAEGITKELKRLSFIDHSLPSSEGLEVRISELYVLRDNLTQLSELEVLTKELKRLSFIDHSLPSSEGLEVRISELYVLRDNLTQLSELEVLTKELKRLSFIDHSLPSSEGLEVRISELNTKTYLQNCKIHGVDFSDLSLEQTNAIITAGAKCSSSNKEFDFILASLLDTYYIKNNLILKEASITQKDFGIKIKILIGAISGFFISLLFIVTRQFFYQKKK
jgi:hypothetical protein